MRKNIVYNDVYECNKCKTKVTVHEIVKVMISWSNRKIGIIEKAKMT